MLQSPKKSKSNKSEKSYIVGTFSQIVAHDIDYADETEVQCGVAAEKNTCLKWWWYENIH